MEVQVISTTEEQKEFDGEKYISRKAQCVGIIDGLSKVFTINIQKGQVPPKPGRYSLVNGYYVSSGALKPFVSAFDPIKA